LARFCSSASGSGGVDEVEIEAAEEQLAHERGLGPFGLARGFGHGAGFALVGSVGGGSGRGAHAGVVLPA